MNGKRPMWEWAFYAGPKDPVTGKRPRKTKGGFKTKTDAENALREALAAHQKQPAAKDQTPMPSFREFATRWHQEVAIRQHSPKTAERVAEHIGYAIRLYGDMPLDQLSTQQLQTDQSRLLDHGGRVTKEHPKGKPLSQTTVRHISFAVQAVLEQAVDWGILEKNPMKKVKKPKRLKREPAVADRDGFERLLGVVAGTSLYAPVMTYMGTGTRRGEMCGLQWTDVDWEKATLYVSKSLEQTKTGLRIKSTKSGRPRRIPLDPGVLEALRDHQREQEEQHALYGADYRSDLNLVFCRPDGYYYSPNRLGTRIKRALVKAGLGNLSLHSLRHSHASQLLRDGVPVAAVSERLGHANANITYGIYTHAMPADHQAAAMVWNNAMKEVIEATRRENLARKRRMTANDSADSGKIRVIPIKSAS
jgi:integrase